MELPLLPGLYLLLIASKRVRSYLGVGFLWKSSKTPLTAVLATELRGGESLSFSLCFPELFTGLEMVGTGRDFGMCSAQSSYFIDKPIKTQQG